MQGTPFPFSEGSGQSTVLAQQASGTFATAPSEHSKAPKKRYIFSVFKLFGRL